MKWSALVLALALTVTACGTKPPAVPGADPLAAVRVDAQKALDALNTASVISTTALTVLKAVPNVPPATVTKVSDAVRAYNCALLDDGNAAPMPDGTTVTASCHAHSAPMLGIISKIQAAGSAPTLHALAQQGLALADQALAALSSSANATVQNFVTVAQATLTVIRSWS